MLFKGSVVSSLARALICIVILSVLSTGLALVTVVSSLSDAEAVNISGSLRMQSYRLAYDITTHSPDLPLHLTQYRQSLQAPALAQLDRFYIPQNVRLKYLALLDRWQILEQEIAANNTDVYLNQVSEYVTQIDLFVLAVQHFSEQKLWGALAISIAGFITTLAVVFFTVHFARRQIVQPLNQMVQASELIQSGNFNPPQLDTSLPNELGLLSASFNTMSSELGKLYRSLEDKVAQKTQMLTQANRRLAVLFDCSQALSSSQLGDECFKNVLAILSQSEKMTAIQLEVQDSGDGRWIISHGQAEDNLEWRHFALQQDGQTIGSLRWQINHGIQPHPQLIQNVANMLSRGIYFNRSQKHHLQLLLMEERATIARELHDSLAQALSFLRIQLTLLNRTLPADNKKALAIAADFDQALATAYRQLRELLATFRLSIEEADLHEALNQLINPLRSQTRAEIQVNCALSSQALNAQQQVHALQIVREAVMNAIKHAEAQNITIDCEYALNGYNMFTISDDGKGIESVEEPEGHYGLNIMSERAERLNGTLTIHRRPEGGTMVQLVFPH
jgi:two-component system nitrate/nitrite sensor histidine kinase NarQ